MAPFPVLTTSDLVRFSGRVSADYPSPFTEGSAIPQAMLFFKLSTGITDWPDTADLAQTALFAVSELANSLTMWQPHQEILSNPFQSESIGTYSYSKISGFRAAMEAGQPTGLLWFDLAVRLLATEDSSDVDYSSMSVFDRDEAYDNIVIRDGVVYGPSNLNVFSSNPSFAP